MEDIGDTLHLGVTQNEGESRSNLNISDVLDAISIADPTFGVEPDMYRPAAAPVTGAVDRPYVRIVEQPAAKSLRFRYQCEGRSAGSIPGANSTPERKTYPTIEVCGYKGRFVVLVSCVTKDKPYRPHPHNLVGREPMCNRGVCTVQVDGDSSTVTFSNLGIQCVKRKDIADALKDRENMKVDPFKTGFTHKNQPQTIDLNAVRLCFQVYIPGGNSTKIKQALYPCVSDVIYDKKAMCELQINRLSSCAASVRGGQEIILLCEKITREDIEVVFSQKQEDGSVWESAANIVLVHRQVAIAFHVPPYRDPACTDHAKVNIFLRRSSDKACSLPVDFEYTPDFADSDYLIKKKRKTAHIESFLQTAYKQDRGFVHDSVIKTEPKEQIASPSNVMGSPHYAPAQFAEHGDPRFQQWIPEQSNLNMPGQNQFITEARGYWGPHNYGQAPSPNLNVSPNLQAMSPGHRLSPMPPMIGQGLVSPMQGGVSPGHPSSVHPSPTPQMMHQASPTPQMMHQASPTPQMMHQASPTPQMMHQASPTPQMMHHSSPTPQMMHQASPTPQMMHQASPTPQMMHQASPTPQMMHQTSPTPQMMHQASPTPQMMHQASPTTQIMPQTSMQIQQQPIESEDVVINSADLSGLIAMLNHGPELTDSMNDLNL